MKKDKEVKEMREKQQARMQAETKKKMSGGGPPLNPGMQVIWS